MPEHSHPKIALLLMAAGSSSRLGQPKQLVEIISKNNAPYTLLQRQASIMDTICSSFNAQAYCVLGFESDCMIKHLGNCNSAHSLTIIDNANWSQGLSTSIAKGVSLVASDASAVLIFLVDQWQLSIENLSQLLIQWQKQPELIHVARLGDSFSPPVIFPRRFFKELIKLSGDEGAKKVIKNNIEQVQSIKMASAFVDLDTPEQLNGLKKQNIII